MMPFMILTALLLAAALGAANGDADTVADLDTRYQAAVAKNDAMAMGAILADDFLLSKGDGTTQDKASLLDEARSGAVHYTRQEDSERSVRVYGDTAVVTAKLWAAYEYKGKSYDYKVWFSDVYVRRPGGWQYVFGQASLPMK
jgi:ketosteroid isomerase-like protein